MEYSYKNIPSVVLHDLKTSEAQMYHGWNSCLEPFSRGMVANFLKKRIRGNVCLAADLAVQGRVGLADNFFSCNYSLFRETVFVNFLQLDERFCK